MFLAVKCDVGEVAELPGDRVEHNDEGARWKWGLSCPKIGT